VTCFKSDQLTSCCKNMSALLDRIELMKIRQYKLYGMGWEDLCAILRAKGASKRAAVKREYFKDEYGALQQARSKLRH